MSETDTDVREDDLDEKEEQQEARMPFTQHLVELRRCLMNCLAVVLVGFGVCYYFSEEIFEIMMLPLLEVLPEGEKLIYTGLPEAFITYLKLSLVGGIILALPVIFHQFWSFTAPGLYRTEKKYLVSFVIFSTVLFVTGGFFGYFIVFPFGFKFFVGFSGEAFRVLPSVKEYFSLAIKLLFGFGVVFELPLVMVFLGKMGIVNAQMLSKGRKFALLGVFVLAAILTPPDVISQLLMAVPLMILYEISIILVRVMGGKREEKIKEMLGEEEEGDPEESA